MKTETRLPISVCIIAGAEAHRIRRTLDSVSAWTSEIIVVINAEVADATEQICLEAGAKVYREPWKGHISQVNSAAAKATQEWLFGLDADEVVTAELRDDLCALFAGGARPDSEAYSVPRLNLYCGRWLRHGDWYPDRKTRLWRRGAAQWGGKNPHYKLITSGPVVKLRGGLEHYSMDDLEHHVRKALSYGTLFAKQYPEDGVRISLFGLWLRPTWRFIRGYFVRLGFLDGWQGFAVAKLIAFETFIRYAKVREIQHSKSSVIRGNSLT